MTISQLTNLKVKTVKKEFHILFSCNLNEKKGNTLVLNFFFSILEWMKIEMLQLLLSIFISVEKRRISMLYQSFFSINAINFQFSNFTNNETSGMKLSANSIMTVSVIECTMMNVVLKVIVTGPAKMFLWDRFSQHCHCRK